MKEHTLVFTAIHELKIDVPVMSYEIKGDTITLHLYGGQVVTYKPQADSPSLSGKAGKGLGH